MTRMKLLLWLGVPSFAVGAVGVAEAQVGSVRQDAATGAYLVRIRTTDGSLGDVRVPAKNRVVGDVAVTVSETADGQVRYRYSVRVRPSSAQALHGFDLPCPSQAAIHGLAGFEYTAAMGKRALVVSSGQIECGATTRLAPGDSAEMTFVSPVLPSIVRAELEGFADVPQWPCECWGDPANEPAMAAIDTLDGTHGGGATALVLAPMRAAALVATPAATILHLQSDLWLLCTPMGIMTAPGICRSLEAKLAAAGDAVARGNLNAARGAAGAVARELEAQRGKQVPELAFALLSFYAQRLTEQLAR